MYFAFLNFNRMKIKYLCITAIISLLCSCEMQNKNIEYSNKYDEILKEEEIYIDSIGKLPYVGRMTAERLSNKTTNLDKQFNLLTKDRTADEYKPTLEQMQRHLDLIKKSRFYIEGADLSKK